MGSASSSIEILNNTRSNVNYVFNQINDEADKLMRMIDQENYTNKAEVCRKIGYLKVDELKRYNIVTLNNIRSKLGIDISDARQTKEQICIDIVNFYMKKVILTHKIQTQLPVCKKIESNIYNKLSSQLNETSVHSDRWLDVYNKMETFNYIIKNRYKLIKDELDKVVKAKTQRELDSIEVNLNDILSKTNLMCKQYEMEFRTMPIRYETTVIQTPVSVRDPTEKHYQIGRSVQPGIITDQHRGYSRRVLKNYQPRSSREVPLVAGTNVILLADGPTDWVIVRLPNGEQGYVPGSYLSRQ